MPAARGDSDSGSEYSPGAKNSSKHAKREREDSSDSEFAPSTKRSGKRQGSGDRSPAPSKARNVGAARRAGFKTGPWSNEEGACRSWPAAERTKLFNAHAGRSPRADGMLSGQLHGALR